ncbi:glycosyltransferase [Halalkalibacter okhensis]|uniref:Amylovoran biosynthesis protein AmsE n=1 Tax=Halalkalibacter okhensis TaxID=333138 RepID=A0A0B0ICT7_9BACI|nr:glycosyltransferase [Halalkalibacter okhensis]KHF38712.1 amylovoran biosynthesis protein AmsE [Halalkalibacter okhensis]
MPFSVLMSIYYKDNPTHLEEAINSIIVQTMPPAEIVLVIDGEVPHELENVIASYENNWGKLFKIVRLSTNKGLGNALEVGVKASSFDIVARMDSDDVSIESRFEKQVGCLLEHPDIDIVGSYISEFEHDINNVVSTRKVPTNDKEIKKFAKSRNPFNHMTVVFRKSSVLKSGNYKEMLWFEDYYLWARMIANGCKMLNIPESLVYARVDNGFILRRGGKRYLLNEIKLQKRFLEMGFIDLKIYYKNIMVRAPVRVLPPPFRKFVYEFSLRSK